MLKPTVAHLQKAAGMLYATLTNQLATKAIQPDQALSKLEEKILTLMLKLELLPTITRPSEGEQVAYNILYPVVTKPGYADLSFFVASNIQPSLILHRIPRGEVTVMEVLVEDDMAAGERLVRLAITEFATAMFEYHAGRKTRDALTSLQWSVIYTMDNSPGRNTAWTHLINQLTEWGIEIPNN